jgi:hypothetical protein
VQPPAVEQQAIEQPPAVEGVVHEEQTETHEDDELVLELPPSPEG